MNLYNFSVSYFSALDWAQIDREYIAESEEQLRVLINKECPPSCRDLPYQGRESAEDSLKIVQLHEVSVPFILHDWNERN